MECVTSELCCSCVCFQCHLLNVTTVINNTKTDGCIIGGYERDLCVAHDEDKNSLGCMKSCFKCVSRIYDYICNFYKEVFMALP